MQEDAQGAGTAAEMNEELQASLAAYEAEAKEIGRPHKEVQGLLLAAVSQAFEQACKVLVQEHGALLITEQDNARVLNHRC